MAAAPRPARAGSTAILFREQPLTYRELDERTTRLAHALRDLGVEPGGRLALLSANHPAYLEGLFAAGLLGAILVPLNARLTTPEIVYALRDSGAKVLVHSAELAENGVAAAEEAGTARRVVVDGDPDPEAVGYEAIIAAASTERIDQPVTRDDPCFIMYTSGTTGYPKGVVLDARRCHVRGDECHRRPRPEHRRGLPRRRAAVPHRRPELRGAADPAQGRCRHHRGRLRGRAHSAGHRRAWRHLLVRHAHHARRDGAPIPDWDTADLRRSAAGSSQPRPGAAEDPAHVRRARREALPGLRTHRDRSPAR